LHLYKKAETGEDRVRVGMGYMYNVASNAARWKIYMACAVFIL
jgi:hypothetical protein